MPSITGSKDSVGTSSVRIVGASSPVQYGTSIKAAQSNMGTVYVGLNSSVTNGSNASTDGYELSAGQEVFIPAGCVADVYNIYLIASAAGQKVYFIAL